MDYGGGPGMGDPRLNSLHLEPARRQEYRRAREALLQARGCQTLYAEARGVDAQQFGHTIIQKKAADPESLACWLADREFIYPLQVGVNTLGRSGDNDVVVADAFVSRRHCAIVVHHGSGCELHDTASKNGTYLNGVRITGPTSLKSGDQIRISNQQFTFVTRAGNPDAAAPQVTLST
jgi:hypothetical protein